MPSVAYLRVSTDDQAESGLGLESQRHAVNGWAEREKCPLRVDPFADEGLSGAAPIDRREGLADAIAALEPGDVLIVAKRDRLGRDPMVLAMIEASVVRKGCRIVSAAGEGTTDDDPSSILMRRLVDAFAEYERLIIKSRTRAALGAKRRRGERTSHTPYGMVLVEDGKLSKKGNLPVTLAVDPAETAVIAEVKALSADGWSLRRIARHLDERGVRPKTGRPTWCHTTVRALVLRPA